MILFKNFKIIGQFKEKPDLRLRLPRVWDTVNTNFSHEFIYLLLFGVEEYKSSVGNLSFTIEFIEYLCKISEASLSQM